MTTRHLSISVTLYSYAEASLALLETICEPGRPARCQQLVTKAVRADLAEGVVHEWLAAILQSERDRIDDAAR